MKNSSLPPSARRAAGFTLIEVMVALILLVLGVLGAAAMTLNALRDGKQSALRSQAVGMAYEMSDLLRMNPGQEAVFRAAAPTSASSGCYAAGCTPDQMAANDYYEWNLKLTSPGIGLPNATAVVCRDATQTTTMSCDNALTSPLVLKMKWDEKRNDGTFGSVGPSTTLPQLVVPMQPTCIPTVTNTQCLTP